MQNYMLIRDICENLNSSMKILSSGTFYNKTVNFAPQKIWELNIFLTCVQQGHVTPIYPSFHLSVNAI